MPQQRTRAPHIRRRRRGFGVLLGALLVLALSACTLPWTDDSAPTATRTTEDTLNPLVPTRAADSGTAASPTADIVQRNPDTEAGWSHGAPLVGGLAVGSNGHLLLAGTLHRRVLEFTADGTTAQTYIAALDEDPAWVSGTSDVAAGPDGRVAFLDADARRVTVFRDPETVALVLPLDPDATPRALLLDREERLYLAENLPNATSRLRVFANDGTLLATWDTYGDEPFPITIQDLALTTAGDGLLLLTDDWQGQPAVLPLTLDGATAGEPLLLDRANTPGVRPTSLSALPDGGVVVADPVWRMLVLYDAEGTITRRIPLMADQHTGPREITVTTLPDGRVASADVQTGMLLIHNLTRVSVDGPTLQTTNAYLPCDRVVRVIGVGFRPGETLIRSTVRIGETVLEGSTLAEVAADGSLALALEPDRWATACREATDTEVAFAPQGNTLDITALASDVTVLTQVTLFPAQPQPLVEIPEDAAPGICGERIALEGEAFAPHTQLLLEQINPLTQEVTLMVEGIQVDAEGRFTTEFTPAAVPGCGLASGPNAVDDMDVNSSDPPTIHLRVHTQHGDRGTYPSASLTIPLEIQPEVTPTP